MRASGVDDPQRRPLGAHGGERGVEAHAGGAPEHGPRVARAEGGEGVALEAAEHAASL
jgi:hypothetical protein